MHWVCDLQRRDVFMKSGHLCVYHNECADMIACDFEAGLAKVAYLKAERSGVG